MTFLFYLFIRQFGAYLLVQVFVTLSSTLFKCFSSLFCGHFSLAAPFAIIFIFIRAVFIFTSFRAFYNHHFFFCGHKLCMGIYLNILNAQAMPINSFHLQVKCIQTANDRESL